MLTKKKPPVITTEIAKSIKTSLESVFTDGIDGLPFVQTDGIGGFTGKFNAHGETYDFFITKDGNISYIEADKRTDSAYVQGYLTSQVRTDKKRMCDRGKPCGNTCIAKGISCRRQLSGAALSSLNAAQQAINLTPDSGVVAGILAGAAIVGLAGLAAAKANQSGTQMWELTPQVNQNYDKMFPSQKDFDNASFDSLVPVTSGSKQKGTHDIYKTEVKGTKFFVKEASDLAVAKEVSSYEIAKELGLNAHVLPAAKVYREDVACVANPLLDKKAVVDLGDEEKIKKALESMDEKQLSKYLLYDYTIHNKDRHSGNVLFRPDGDLYLIDHGAVRWDLPGKVSSGLDTKKNVFFKYGFKGDKEKRLPKEEIDNVLNSRQAIKDNLEYRYAGQPKYIVNPILSKFDDRMDVLQEMSKTGDTRIRKLVEGKEGFTVSQSQVFSKKPIPDMTINGVKLESSDPHHYLATPDVDLNEPEYPKGTKTKKTGAVVMEPDGRMWIYEPTGHYAGTKNTFSKGGVEDDLSVQQNALKEVKEELGLQVKLIAHLGDFSHKTGEKLNPQDKDKTVTRFYVAKRIGGAPWEAHWEADKVKLVAPDEARKLFNKPRDRKILDYVDKYTTSSQGLETLKKAHTENTPQSSWKAGMSAQEADKWAKNSVWKDTVFHATHKNAVEPISTNGFNLGIKKVGRAYGNGVYLGVNSKHVEGYRQLYGDKGSEGVTMKLKINVNKVMDIDREMEVAKRRRRPSHKWNNPRSAMREIAHNLKSRDAYDAQVKRIERENVKVKRLRQQGKITEEEYNRRYASRPQSEAFSTVIQRAGYDAIKTSGGRNKIPMLVVYDPKKVTVVGKAQA